MNSQTLRQPIGLGVALTLVAIACPAQAKLSDAKLCLASAPTPLTCVNTTSICREVDARTLRDVLDALDTSLALARRMTDAVAAHPKCGVGKQFRRSVDNVSTHLQKARKEMQEAHDRTAAGGGVPSYALAGHIEGYSRRALKQVALATYHGSLTAVYCPSQAFRSDEAVAVFEHTQQVAVLINEVFLRATRCYVSAYLGKNPRTGRCSR